MHPDLKETIGFSENGAATPEEQHRVREYVNLKLAARGYPIVGDAKDYPFLEMGKSFLANFQERMRLLSDYLCPADQMVHEFLCDYLSDVRGVFAPDQTLVPNSAMVLERHGIARLLSLPAKGNKFESDIVSSYRVSQGVCHNPKSDRRTTKGVFHVAEGGLPVPADKKAVPKIAFAHLLNAALHPPDELMELPFTSEQEEPARVFVSLLLRPLICPKVDGFIEEKSMEIRFFAPGNLVSNLDFVESIFGNAGDPFLPENNARLDVEHWSGHSGCVILAPHLIRLKKKDVGLPHISEATDRQKRDGMCWENEDELYNDGGAFKITCRDKRGIVVTVIADNYFGYCKKEVKTQISYATNLFGLAEEEHAGGAIAFPSFDLGEEFHLSGFRKEVDHSFADLVENFGELMDVQPEGYAIDKTYPDIVYLPESVDIDLHTQKITWTNDSGDQLLKLQPRHTYLLPSGYKIEMRKPNAAQRWRLIGTNAEGTMLHKPCTVSGGGKSEISKPVSDAMLVGPVFMPDLERDLKLVDEMVNRDFGDRWKQPDDPDAASRPILDPSRSLGSAIRLLSTSPDYTDEYNEWVRNIPKSARNLMLILKRYWKPDWGDDWQDRFRVDTINGSDGVELKYRDQKVVTQYIRLGYQKDGSWRTFSLRKDFHPAKKLQRQDDITASITVPASQLNGLHPDVDRPSYKFVQNCEYRLFQRPDEAIHRGYDHVTEHDFSRPGNFFSNYEPLTRSEVEEIMEDTIRFEQFTPEMQQNIRDFLASDSEYFISSAHPRIVDGVPTKNPRYLQNRPDLEDQRSEYLADIGARLYRRVPCDKPAPSPVNAVLPGRRNNPAEPGIRPLAVFGPIHYQELPELFMDYVSSLTGKSPSTTGAGSEGALTKAPFNALLPVSDLNAALVSYLLGSYAVYSSAAGWIGSKYRVDHDVSLIVPEVWSRMFIPERDPEYLLEKGFLEAVEDFEHEGRSVLASRLGFRITESFVTTFFGRVFNEPEAIFPEDMLRPEVQSMEEFVDGVHNIVETQQKVAMNYFEDGSVDIACPPLKALLNIMAHGEYEGKDARHPDIRSMFTLESLLESEWYQERLECRLDVDYRLLERQLQYLDQFLKNEHYSKVAAGLDIEKRRALVSKRLEGLRKRHSKELERLKGTIGVDPALV